MTLILTVILIALVFEYINGFHDTANSIATVVSTKVLSPRNAVILAAITNLLGALWGTAVAKTIGGQPRTTVTDPGGQFRFLNLDAATYTITVELAGFQKQSRDVIVNTGVNAQIPFTLAVGTLAETVIVSAASPVVDVKKAGTATTLTTAMLERVELFCCRP